MLKQLQHNILKFAAKTTTLADESVACTNSDDPCIKAMGQGSCCLYAKVTEVPKNPTEDELKEQGKYVNKGWPVTEG